MRKSLSLILSILLVLTLCLGGCNPSEPEEPSASLGESSIPEESSVRKNLLSQKKVPFPKSLRNRRRVLFLRNLLCWRKALFQKSPLNRKKVLFLRILRNRKKVPFLKIPLNRKSPSVPEDSSLPEESSIPEESSQPEESSVPEDPSRSVERPLLLLPGDTEEMLAAFPRYCCSLEEEHGKTTGKADGLCFVKLIDLDRDGVDELFCAWEVAQYNFYMTEIYQWIDNEAVLLTRKPVLIRVPVFSLLFASTSGMIRFIFHMVMKTIMSIEL